MGDPDTRTLPAAAPGAGADSTATGAAATGPAPPAALPLPTIPKYTIVRQLGRGGMGVVYEAVGPLGVRVALKLVLPERLSPNLLARFRQEARAMMDLTHPNLARIFDYDECTAGPYFTMRLLPGDTLAGCLDRLRPDPAAGVRLMVRVADAVAYLHARGLVHRDLKPSNILVDDRGEPHVSDFGLIKDLAAAAESDGEGTPATPAGGTSATLTHPGARLGTEAYMSPEQFVGDQSRIGPPTDVWALGVILHELAWGDRPRFDTEHQVQLPADDGGSPVRTGLRPIVTRCLAWDPADRYPTAADLGAELEALLAPPGPRPTRRRFVGAAAGVLGLSTVAAWWAFGRKKDDGGSAGPEYAPGALYEIRQELAARGSVDLLRPDGSWRWSEWLSGSGTWTPDPAGGGTLSPTGKGKARLFEVARGLDPGFRLVVELAHVGPGGEVGLYVGRSVQPTDRGPVHCAITLVVDDHAHRPSSWLGPRLRRRVQARACSTVDADGFKDALPSLYDRPEPGVAGRPVAVGLALSATHVVTASAGGRELLRAGRNRFAPAIRSLGTWGGDGLMPTFDPGDGIGLLLYHSALVVRSARIERPGLIPSRGGPMADPTKPPDTPKPAPPGVKPTRVKGQFQNHGQLTDSTGLPQAMQGGIAIKAGSVDLTGVQIDTIQGVGALFISDDETFVQGGMVTNATGTPAPNGLNPPVTWSFRWDAVPAFGQGVLRLIEMTVDPSGAELTFAVTVVEDPDNDPVAIGNPGP